MTISGVLVTHHHADHVGGAMMGYRIQGLAEVLARTDVPVHAHRQEAALVAKVTGLAAGDVVAHDSGDRVSAGGCRRRVAAYARSHPGQSVFSGGRHARRR